VPDGLYVNSTCVPEWKRAELSFPLAGEAANITKVPRLLRLFDAEDLDQHQRSHLICLRDFNASDFHDHHLHDDLQFAGGELSNWLLRSTASYQCDTTADFQHSRRQRFHRGVGANTASGHASQRRTSPVRSSQCDDGRALLFEPGLSAPTATIQSR
jgi:hypothetical protein